MKRLFSLLLTILLAATTIAQKQVQIVDSLTGKGLPFATIECFAKGWGLYTDSIGHVAIPENKLNEVGKASYVGYQSKEVILKNTTTISLNPLPQKLQDVTVVSCKETVIKAIKTKENDSHYFSFYPNTTGCTWASFIPNKLGKAGYLISLTYNANGTNNNQKPKAPVRLRFFEYDSTKGLPTDEICFENIIVAPIKNRRVTQDLTKYKIFVPTNGVVIAFEMFESGQEYHYTTNTKMIDGTIKILEHYGWSLMAAKKGETIAFSKAPGKEWYRYGEKSNLFNAGPAVSLEIQVCK